MKNQIRTFLYGILSFVLLLSVGVGSATTASAKEPKGKKKVVTIYMPEPDKVHPKPPLQQMATPSREARNPMQVAHHSVEGIDVSHYQGRIDWKKVAGSKVVYAYLKATEGASLVDDTYRRNLEEARKNGLKVGSYHFYRANVSVEEQLRNMTSVVKAKEQDLLPIIDVEVKPRRISEEKFVRDLKRFLERVTQHYGRRPIIYTFYNFYNRHLAGRLPGYQWMIARYSELEPMLNDGQEYVIWQYTSGGELDGIRGPVDRSLIMSGNSLSDILF